MYEPLRLGTVSVVYILSFGYPVCLLVYPVTLDHSLVTEFCFTFQMFYDEGFHGMGMHLEMIYLLFTSFYDKSLIPANINSKSFVVQIDNCGPERKVVAVVNKSKMCMNCQILLLSKALSHRGEHSKCHHRLRCTKYKINQSVLICIGGDGCSQNTGRWVRI